MRVISGTHGGRRLRSPDTAATRPVADRVKESLFSSLGTSVAGARVADLFAGAGSFGIEALSRGASSAVFVEHGRKALAALDFNIESLGLEHAIVERADVLRWVEATERRFDLVFCDPPWPMEAATVSSLLERLSVHLEPDAVVVITRRASDPLPSPAGFAIDDDRTLGDTRIIRYMLLGNTS